MKGSPHNQLVKDSIQSGCKEQQPDWSEAIAVGCQQFIADIHNQLNCKSFERKILKRAYSGANRPPIPLQSGPPVPEQTGPGIPL